MTPIPIIGEQGKLEDRNVLGVCLPMTDRVTAEFAISLAAMFMRLGTVPCGMDQVVWIRGGGTVLPSVRHGIAERAIQQRRATHLLWIDSDHRFPADTAHRLLAHHRPIVGINATTRTPPLRFTARTAKGEAMVTGPNDKGVERAWRIGFGIVLIEARVFLAMEKPWFLTEWVESDADKSVNSFRGEDVYFCEKAKAAGFQPMVDHDLTKETAHVGAVPWTVDMIPDTQGGV